MFSYVSDGINKFINEKEILKGGKNIFHMLLKQTDRIFSPLVPVRAFRQLFIMLLEFEKMCVCLINIVFFFFSYKVNPFYTMLPLWKKEQLSFSFSTGP